ncbi:Endopolyphosphatase [Lithohypha guttulata]|uniref:Endopolyphosphatase n=1 Tax=Lithohypha guttulata TaxID=1690604 RepID=A0AAN7YJX9_9EURO|nr:Endopolyphosphatase [Lithohypha guttulata]
MCFTTALPPIPTVQDVLNVPHAGLEPAQHRKLQGKFLHITDIHPDPFYQQGSDPGGEHPCHRGEGRAGYFGAESTECDAPISLINATFDWIKHNIRDEIDFVIWTGDSARHDNDELYPRTNKQVEQLNEFMVSKFDEVFGKPDNRHDPDPTNDFIIPIVPTFGNNDILPHNIFEPGPNRWTRKYLTIWEKFVPQEQRHSFARGGWFFTEVIPKRLAVFSLNTLYFFDSNAAVDGCDNPHEPGYEHFEWLRIQLQFLRERKMKAILMGHVPPARTQTKRSWDETCYQKYNLWLRQYRDVIIGNLFGHMNIDHIMLQDVKELQYKFKIPGIDDEGLHDELGNLKQPLHTTAKTDYLSDLRDLWTDLPTPPKGFSYDSTDLYEPACKDSKNQHAIEKFIRRIGGKYGERFSLSIVAPSVVPNFYPTLRIVEYNITGLEHEHPASTPASPGYIETVDLQEFELEHSSPGPWIHTEDSENDLSLEYTYRAERRKRKKHKKPKPNFVVPMPPSKNAPPGPGYSPQSLSFLSMKQYYSNITKINDAVVAKLSSIDELHVQHRSKDEVLRETLKQEFAYELEYDTKNDKVYRMKDLTMRSWLGIAEKIGRTEYEPQDTTAEHVDLFEIGDECDGDSDEDAESSIKKKHKKGKKRKNKNIKKNKLWHTFVKRAFVGTKSDEELEEEFG